MKHEEGKKQNRSDKQQLNLFSHCLFFPSPFSLFVLIYIPPDKLPRTLGIKFLRCIDLSISVPSLIKNDTREDSQAGSIRARSSHSCVIAQLQLNINRPSIINTSLRDPFNVKGNDNILDRCKIINLMRGVSKFHGVRKRNTCFNRWLSLSLLSFLPFSIMCRCSGKSFILRFSPGR